MSVYTELIHEPIPQRLGIPFELNRDSIQSRDLEFWLPILDGQLRDRIRGGLVTPTDVPVIRGEPVVGRALVADGVNDAATTSTIRLSDTDKITVSFWFFKSSYADDDQVLMELTDNTNGRAGFFVDPNSSAGARFRFATGTTSGNNGIDVDRPTANVWHHCVVTMDRAASSGNVMFCYFDGRPAANSTPFEIGVPTGNWVDDNLYLFSRGASSLFGAYGLADLRIYKGRLLAPQVIYQMWAPETRWELFRPSEWRTLVKVAAGGATQYNVDITGTVTPTGAMVKQVGLHLVGSETPVGTLTRRISKTETGTVTPAGALVKQVGLHVAGMLTPAGALVKRVGLHLSGSETPTGTLVALKVAIVNATGTVTPAGALVRRVGKVFAGTVTPAGAMVKQASLHLAGTLTPAGALVKRAGKVLAGTVTPAGALTALKVALVNAAGTVTPVGTLVKQVSLHLVGAVTPAGAMVRQAGLHLAGSLTPAGALVKRAQKVLAGLLTAVGDLTTALIPGSGPAATGPFTAEATAASFYGSEATAA